MNNNNQAKKLILGLYITISWIGLQSCQKSEINNLQDAQLCLNTATAANAKACVAGIESNKTAFADSLRCSSIFISEGFGSPAELYNALNQISGGSSTSSALVGFSFSGAGNSTPEGRATNSATATEAFTVCSQSDVKFYAQISSLFKIGTLTTMYANIPITEATDIATINAALDLIPNATLGEIVTTTYTTVCTNMATDAPESTKEYCAELNLALTSTGSTDNIGSCLKARLKDPNLTACP